TAPLIFTDLFVNNLRINPTDNKSPLKQSIMYTDKVSLSHKQNSLSVRFARFNYSGADIDQIFYMLEGFDDTWIPAVDNQPIVYSNLKPGNYKLVLGIAGEDLNDPVKSVKSLSIKIKPPFWLNGWAFLFYFLLVIQTTFLLIRYISRRNRLKEKVRMRDFEQQKERELYQSKINFFTNLTHEIRTPLTLIKAPLDYVLMTENIPDNVKENLQIMSKNTSRLLNLTKQLLDFRKTESEAYLLSLKTQNVTELIRESVLRFTPLAKQKNVFLEIDLPPSDMFVQLDKEAFLKIISNLLSNAIKYCDHYVRLEANIKDNEIQEFNLITENDGELIPPSYEVEIFKPFIQIETGKDKNVSGTGIGLALASSLADLHGGSLMLENDTDYNRFHLKLPVGNIQYMEDEALALDNKKIQIQINEDTQRKEATILLVDDDVELLQFEAKFLSERYNVIVAENGVQALEQLKKSNVNLIVTDVMMPEMDGFAFTEKVKLDIEYSHIPVILLTAKVMAQAKVQGYELGADAYLEKPFSVEVLLARINNLLQNREKLRETFLKHPFIGINTVALTKSDEAFITKLNEVIHDNLSDSDFNVEDMAERFNMSRASFYRKVKGVLDLTPNEYIRVERLKKAAQLLKDDEHKINEICYMVGFNSPSYFAKCFYQQFGILPKDFQEQK
ncbi:MAG: response regulator, partial [Dysgonamonadaceae bacterium]